jgi:CarD family transcriptional regulator
VRYKGIGPAGPILFLLQVSGENAIFNVYLGVYAHLIAQRGASMTENSSTDKSEQNKSDQEKSETKRFKVGDLAVYPAHGVGRIEAIETKVVNGEEHDFYIMKVLENGMVIMIPTWNVASVGLRDVIGKKEIPKIIDVIKSKRELSIDNQTWNRRYREYMDKIKTGSLYEVAEVFRDLSLLKLTKDLSFGERKLYDTAHTLLIKELSTAKNSDEKAVAKEIEALFDFDKE